VDTPKTRAERRDLPLPGDLTAALKTWRANLGAALGFQTITTESYVFVDEAGIPIRPEWYSDEWVRLSDNLAPQSVEQSLSGGKIVTSPRWESA
jgi:hypothetical protein